MKIIPTIVAFSYLLSISLASSAEPKTDGEGKYIRGAQEERMTQQYYSDYSYGKGYGYYGKKGGYGKGYPSGPSSPGKGYYYGKKGGYGYGGYYGKKGGYGKGWGHPRFPSSPSAPSAPSGPSPSWSKGNGGDW